MLQVRPFRCQKMSRRLTKILERDFQTAPRAPLEQLQKEAKAFEEMIKKPPCRRNAVIQNRLIGKRLEELQ